MLFLDPLLQPFASHQMENTILQPKMNFVISLKPQPFFTLFQPLMLREPGEMLMEIHFLSPLGMPLVFEDLPSTLGKYLDTGNIKI